MGSEIADNKYLIAFSTFVPFGTTRVTLLKNYFGSYHRSWSASRSELTKIGISETLVQNFTQHRERLNLEVYLKTLENLNISAVSFDSEEYPSNLLKINSYPLVLYVKGKLLPRDTAAVSIVGTRKMSSYGKFCAEEFSKVLSENNFTIVSGLARGVDTVAHKTALKCKGRTIAVVSSGLDRVYPRENYQLASQIVKSGSALVTEYPLGYPSYPMNFAMRNRIISGLSRAVVVVEGRAKSGTLLTASRAAEQGVDVYAIPGPINSPNSEAAHYLLKNGAKIAAHPNDVLEDLNIISRKINEVPIQASGDELEILNLLEEAPLHIDEVVRMCRLDISEVVSRLTVLELKGLVKNVGGKVYLKKWN